MIVAVESFSHRIRKKDPSTNIPIIVKLSNKMPIENMLAI
jgi:hypothetical protein